MAGRVYRETLGNAPARAIVESSATGSSRFAAENYAKTRYCFASRPSGADILVGGTSAGHTPACVDGLRPGEDTDIQLTLPGRVPAKVEPAKVRASTGNLTELDCVLAKQGSAGASACKITY
jgi:hypothetical protein